MINKEGKGIQEECKEDNLFHQASRKGDPSDTITFEKRSLEEHQSFSSCRQDYESKDPRVQSVKQILNRTDASESNRSCSHIAKKKLDSLVVTEEDYSGQAAVTPKKPMHVAHQRQEEQPLPVTGQDDYYLDRQLEEDGAKNESISKKPQKYKIDEDLFKIDFEAMGMRLY